MTRHPQRSFWRTSLLYQIRIFLCILFLLTGTTSADSLTAKIDKLFVPWDKPDSPGCMVAVIRDGGILYARGYGMANLEHKIPITAESVFYVGSISKQFTAFCIALLAQDGLLSLDDDIRIHLPEMPDYGTPITLRHCLHHTSGLRDYLTLLGIAGIPFGYYHQKEAFELIRRQQELNFPPGTEHLYSNSGYLLLAEVVERVSGRSLRRFAHERIFEPLGMTESHFHDDYTRLIPNRAAGYFPADEGGYKNFISKFDCVGSGGLFTTVNDLFLWDQNFEDAKLGGRDLIHLIQTPGSLSDGKAIPYAFGLRIDTTRGLDNIGHSGSLEGYRSAYLRFPEHRFSVICLANLSSINPTRLCESIAEICLSDAVRAAAPAWRKKTARPPDAVSLPLSKMTEKSGVYIRLSSGDTISILFRDGSLKARWRGRTYELQPINETDFLFEAFPFRRARLSFRKGRDERAYHLQLQVDHNRPLTFVPLRTTQLAEERLSEYSGYYYSEELQRNFRLSMKQGDLLFTHPNAPTEPLKYILHDTFKIGEIYLHFLRGENDLISGFRMDAGRVKNLKFIKRTN